MNIDCSSHISEQSRAQIEQCIAQLCTLCIQLSEHANITQALEHNFPEGLCETARMARA